jgi:hypothetical protein
LELNRTFENPYDPRERWWGIEVSFPPALDAVFGVTNNKQSATEFRKLSEEEDAEAEKMSVAEFTERLKLDNDPRLVMYDISKAIESVLDTIRKQINRMREGERIGKVGTLTVATAETIATQALRRRQEKLGQTAASDKDENTPADERTETLAGEILQEGVGPEVAHELAVDLCATENKILFRHADFPCV